MSEVKLYMHSDQRGSVEVHRGKYVLYEDYAALQQKLGEVRQYNVEYAEKELAMQQKLDALAAENAALKEAAKSSTQHWAAAENGSMVRLMDKCMPKLREALSQTPATDAYLNSVRADELSAAVERVNEKAARHPRGSSEWEVCQWLAITLNRKAKQLRAGQEAK